MYIGGINIITASKAYIFLIVKLFFIILLPVSCNNAKDKTEEKRIVTADPTLSPGCGGNACSVATWRWNRTTKRHTFKNTDESRTIVVTIDNTQFSQTWELAPNEEVEADFNEFIDPYHSNFKQYK